MSESTQFKNPKPVSVILVPVLDQDGIALGFVGLRRANEPKRGLWALPGGFIETSAGPETSEVAAVRELSEETGLVSASPALWCSKCTPDGTVLLLFHRAPPITWEQFQAWRQTQTTVPNEEVEAVDLLTPETPVGHWAFPLHLQAAQEAWALDRKPVLANPPPRRPMTP